MTTKNTFLFDLDGTLTDTEKYYRRYWPQAAKELGYFMSDEMSLQLRSLGRPFGPELFKEWYGSEDIYWKIRSRRTELMNDVFLHEGIQLKPGAVQTLKWLKENNYTIAIATANAYEKAISILDRVGISGYFDKVICATMVTQGKPAKDVYEFACRELGRNPGECYAVEDSPNGVLSAYRAGCSVIMVPDQTEPDKELTKMITFKASCLTDIIDFLQ